MVVDARTLSSTDVIETDVCVVGAGPIGLTLARELAAKDTRVCVLELGHDPEGAGSPVSEHVLGGEVTDPTYPPLESMRATGFGGTVSIWTSEVARGRLGARYGQLEPIDLERRDEVAYGGWPFDRTHLEPYYARAAAICEIAPFLEDPGDWETPPRALRLPLGEDAATRIVRYGSRSVFTTGYRDWARTEANVTVVFNARVLEVETDESGSTARSVRVASAPGQTFTVATRVVVLSLGGIENARLLLLSNRAKPAGLGNGADLVGRFFMDHPTAAGRFIPAGPHVVEQLGLYDALQKDGSVAQGVLGLSEPTIRRERLLNSGAFLIPTAERWMRALNSAVQLGSAAKHRRIPHGAAKHLLNVALGADAVATSAYRHLVDRLPALQKTTRFWPTSQLLDTFDTGHIAGWSRLPFAGRRFDRIGFFHVLEQAPEPERRVALSSKKDAFGQPVPRLRWFITDQELRSMRRTQEILATAFARAGLGRLITTAELLADGSLEREIYPSAHHHLGTTRMHTDPRRGVVDENCRIHGTTNVFVSGTSVFPTGGFINPTLTTIALAVRLAEHVSASLQVMPEKQAS
jgi:choline dehydrogenase-like flavoprotein